MKLLFAHLKNRLGRGLRFWRTAGRSERGQVLVVVTIAMIALIAFVGITVDVGLLYIQHGRLRRAVDAAALAASAEFRKGYEYPTGHDNLVNVAREFLKLNGFDPDDPKYPYTPRVETCESAQAIADARALCILNGEGDRTDCTHNNACIAKRKLVWVEASTVMETTFLKVLGIQSVPLTAQATSETASLDVVLVIDTSESMTWEAGEDDPMRDPSQCNPLNDCHPFREVKEAAKAFVEQLYFPYDRVAIITFDQTAHYVMHFSDDETVNNQAYVKGVIDSLQVFTPEVCLAPGGGPCRHYIDENGDGIGDKYYGVVCPELDGYGDSYPAHNNASPCGTTNIGAGLLYAGNEFGGALDADPPPDPPITIRTNSLWAVILLSDGAANSSYGMGDYCVTTEDPICRDKWADTRHCHPDSTNFSTCLARGGVEDPDNYDVMDFAMDMADFVFDDQQAIIFSIGLGPEVQNKRGLESVCDPESSDYDEITCERGDTGEHFLEYAADPDGDETPAGGAYYYAPSGGELREIFLEIAKKLATRLTK